MKNEVGNIKEWAESARQVADQILVVDTGSTDGTLEALREEEGVTLLISDHFTKDTARKDFKFDVARNEALEFSECDWNMAVDADERVLIEDPTWREKLESLSDNVDMVMCTVLMLGDDGSVATDFKGERLFRNREDIRYVGGMHNLVDGVPQNKRITADWLKVTSCRDKRTKEARLERHLQRMEMAEEHFLPKIKENPKDTRSMFYLARTYKEDSQPVKAIYWYSRYLSVGSWEEEMFQAGYEMASCLHSIGDTENARAAMMDSIHLGWRRAEAYELLGNIAYANDDWAQASWWFKVATMCESFDSKMFLNPKAYTWAPWDNLSMSEFHARRYTAAYEAAKKALTFDDLPDNHRERITRNLQNFRPRRDGDILQGRVSPGLKFFEPAFHESTKLDPYTRPDQPVVFYGCYPDLGDVEAIMAHTGFAILVWCGSDATNIGNRPEYNDVLNKEGLHHVATSEFIVKDLESAGISPKYLPIILSDLSRFKPIPRGDKVYIYGNRNNEWLYGLDVFEKVKELTPHVEYVERYSPLSDEEKAEDVFDLYAQCFVGLRLTRHDGVSHTSAELGLMGRNVIWNGCLPNAMPWDSGTDIEIAADGIAKMILSERQTTGQTHADLARSVNDHIRLPDNWLNISFWQ